MANRARGETELQAGGKSYRLRLTLGALAEIEDGLALGDLSEIETRLKNLRAADLAIVLAALLRGGGHDFSPVEALRLPADLSAIVKAITEAFSFGTEVAMAPQSSFAPAELRRTAPPEGEHEVHSSSPTGGGAKRMRGGGGHPFPGAASSKSD